MPGLQASRALGIAAGAVISPLLYPFFFARGARFFHPSGVVHSARVVPPSGVVVGAPADLAARLAGPALVRFSGGWFSGDVGKDSLGISLRFHGHPLPSVLHGRGDQDLYFVSFPSFAPRKFISGINQTYPHDYLANTYWTVVPYAVEGFGRVSLRLSASGAGRSGADRSERLQRAAEEGVARLLLEVAPLGTDLYLAVAEIRLGSRLSQDMERTLRTVPGSSGRGLRPSGFLQGLRVVPYAASQHARRLRGR